MRSAILLACLAACSPDHPSKPAAAAPPPAPAPVPAPQPAADPPPVPTGPPPPIADAIARSKAEHKPLVVEFSTTWCKPCKLFEQSIGNPRLRAAAARAIFVRYDAEAAGPGSEAAKQFKINTYPTFLAIDKDGVVRGTQAGLQGDGVDQFVAFVTAAESTTMDEADVTARLAAAPHEVDGLLAAARWYADRGRTKEAIAQYNAVAAEPAATEAQRADAHSAGVRIERVARWKAELVGEKLALARTAPGSIAEADLVIATVDSGAAPADVKDAIARVLAAHGDAESLNGLLYVALAAGATDEALAAAQRVLSTSTDPLVMDTLAECYHVHGDHADALRVEDAALELASPAVAEQLAPNRARFAAGTGGSDEVERLHAQAQAFARRLAEIDRPAAAAASDAATAGAGTTAAAAGPGGDASAMQDAAMTAFMAARQLGADTGAACAKAAGKAQRAFAQVALGADGKVASTTVFTDATAPAALRACITKQLAAATLPVVPGMTPQPIEITFGSAEH